MAKTSRTYRLDNEILGMIQKIADDEFDGNSTAAIESMCNQSAMMRSVDDRIRHIMYSSAKNEVDHTEARTLIDALHI